MQELSVARLPGVFLFKFPPGGLSKTIDLITREPLDRVDPYARIFGVQKDAAVPVEDFVDLGKIRSQDGLAVRIYSNSFSGDPYTACPGLSGFF